MTPPSWDCESGDRPRRGDRLRVGAGQRREALPVGDVAKAGLDETDGPRRFAVARTVRDWYNSSAFA